ncbi:hypothetical protein [Microbacterium sp.]|uniref:hypothetical protein n=1 Tax=Microbacterium sp. TaxID=51671 RepID=UPI0039E69515
MFVSAEILAIVLSAIGIVLSLGTSMFAGLAWVVRRIDSVEEKLTARIDAVDLRLSARIDALAAETTEVKIAVARLEGPPRHLYVSGR